MAHLSADSNNNYGEKRNGDILERFLMQTQSLSEGYLKESEISKRNFESSGGSFMDSMQQKLKEEESNSPSGSEENDGTSMADEEADRPNKRGKRYHRHTPYQIAEMEQLFKDCPHPDEKQRNQLSTSLGLEPRQVKFWFQNRRTQMKAHTERAENSILRAENDRIRMENNTLREALKNASCPKCGTSVVQGLGPEIPPEVMKIIDENKHLRAEIERVSVLTSRHLSGVTSPDPISAPSLSVPKLNTGNDSSAMASIIQNGLSDPEKSVVYDLATSAMEELVQMGTVDEPLWSPGTRSGDQSFSVDELNYDEYLRRFGHKLTNFSGALTTEASRATGLVGMSAVAVVETIMDPARWAEVFSTLVARSVTCDTISTGNGPGKRSGALLLMYAESQVLSPLVATREHFFLRYCKQLSDGRFAIADVSVDSLRENPPAVMLKCRRRPSGYIIQEITPTCARVTAVEHVEADHSSIHHLFRNHVSSGAAFGATRWLGTLQRQVERLSAGTQPKTQTSLQPPSPAVSLQGKKSLLKLAARMASHFSICVSASTQHTWTNLPGSDVADVRIMTRKSTTDPGEPHGIILSAATTVRLSAPAHRLFTFLKDEKSRGEWDILANGGTVSEMGRVFNGGEQGNCVSLLKVEAPNAGQGNMLILQENTSDVNGAMIVYAPVDIPAMQQVISGGESGTVALLPSGFVIVPDILSGDRSGSEASLLTVAFQILVNPQPQASLSVESIGTMNSLISCTVQKIRQALNCV